jgi:membrane protein
MPADVRSLARDTLSSFSRHGGRMLAAAVAFSSLLSVAPLLDIALQVAGVMTSEDAARAAVVADLARWLGAEGARTVGALLDRAQSGGGGASLLSGVVLAYASTRLFSQLKRALDHMWDVQPLSAEGLRGKAWKQLRKRAAAFAMVIVVGLMIVLVVAGKALLSAAAETIGGPPAGLAWRIGQEMCEELVSVATATLLFAIVFKVMPDAKLSWRDTWIGAFVTAVLFSVGAALIATYLGHKALESTYGAAASIVMLLLWVHYSAQAFFVGAAFTAVYAESRGRRIERRE